MTIDPRAKYEVRPHPIKGLLTIVWVSPGDIPFNVVTLGEDRLPLMAKALNEHLSRNPKERTA